MADTSALKIGSVRKRLKDSLIPGKAGLDGIKDVRVLNKPGRTKIDRSLGKGFRTGKTGKSREAAAQVAAQQQTELLRKAESEDEIARRKGLASSKKSGRQSLIKSSPTGLATTLGG
jgi:hypothetical protein